MKKFIFSIIVAAFANSAMAATVYYGDSILNYAETTPWGNIEIDFKRCMANNLYTFSSVRVDGHEINHTESDNIGPFLIDQKGWSGGNHLNGDRRSAYTESVEVSLDGRQLRRGESATGQVLTVEVVNRLLHPSDDSPLATERMVYNVSGNSIEVFANHIFGNETPETIERYYGMQSMSVGETELLTPGGKFCSWTPVSGKNTGDELQFTKQEAPHFNTFIEHNPYGYQAAHLFADGLGKRNMVRDNDIIFIGNSWTKSYHKIISMQPVKKGKTFSWHGLYSWFNQPVSDNSRTDSTTPGFDYAGYIDGKPYLFHFDHKGRLTITKL